MKRRKSFKVNEIRQMMNRIMPVNKVESNGVKEYEDRRVEERL